MFPSVMLEKTQLLNPNGEKSSPESSMNSHCLSVWVSSRATEKTIRTQTRKVMFWVSLVPRIRCWNPPSSGEGWAVSCRTLPAGCVGQAESSSSLHPWPAASHVWPYKHGNSSLMEEHALEWFNVTQNSRCSCDQHRLLFIWRAGVSTSPLQLLAYKGGGFYLSKDSGCMFRRMALHFRLFWQPNMIQQPISGPRLSSRRTTKNKQAIC